MEFSLTSCFGREHHTTVQLNLLFVALPMPKYYCDYCDIYLTHDSPSVRKSHNEGWKHKAIVKAYYSLFERDETQLIIEQKIKEHETNVLRST